MGFKKSTAPTSAIDEGIADLPGALLQLDDASPSLRQQAVTWLAGHGEGVEELGSRLPEEPDARVREEIFLALRRIGGSRAAAILLECLRSDDVALRNDAIRTAAFLPEEVSARIEDLLRDEDPDVRIFSLDILQQLQHPDIVSWCLRVLMEDTHHNVVAVALDRLMDLPSLRVKDALPTVLERFPEDEFLRFAVEELEGLCAEIER